MVLRRGDGGKPLPRSQREGAVVTVAPELVRGVLKYRGRRSWWSRREGWGSPGATMD